MARKRPAQETAAPAVVVPTVPEVRKPLVFISHDTRDADIAEAFTNLLTDASGGVLQSFRSSDRKGVAGIEFGAEWYRTIMERIENATDVVALLTTFSINRPWILYEAGVAKGRLDRIVFGLALGIPLAEASVGPFAQFQNSGDDEDSLTKLVLQLIRRNPDADPREEAVRRQVIAFRDTVAELIRNREEPPATDPVVEENETEDVAKLFEEVKAMFRELPERLEGTLAAQLSRGQSVRQRKLTPALLLRDIVFAPDSWAPEERVAVWLIGLSPVRDALPWLYDILLEVQRSVMRGQTRQIKDWARTLDHLISNPKIQDAIHELSARDAKSITLRMIHAIPEMLRQIARELPQPSGFTVARRVGSDTTASSKESTK